MAKLYFRYGAMGSSKTANALMVEYNYYERGKKALLVKPKLDNRDGDRTIRSRIGLSKEGAFLEELEGDKRELEIICRNSTGNNVEVRQNHLPVTKKDRRFHGYGTRIIREIVEKYQGEILYTSDDREIEASVRLKRNVKTNEL